MNRILTFLIISLGCLYSFSQTSKQDGNNTNNSSNVVHTSTTEKSNTAVSLPYGTYGVKARGQAMKEMRKVRKLEKKLSKGNASSVKYKNELKQLKDTLQRHYEMRVAERLDFLEQFYTDLFLLDNQAMTQRYRPFCSTTIKDILKKVYGDMHGEHGYAWSLFTDNIKHLTGTFRLTYLNGDPQIVEDKELALFMFDDSVRQVKPIYRFCNEEDKWFLFSMGDCRIYVQVDGSGNDLVITGLANTYHDVWAKFQ
ncbi:MAG: hypothetical protein ILA34_02635 [Bacteroidaceae bacterium]|nr:hypothetical protein [Bacteroidaceae bacterium]